MIPVTQHDSSEGEQWGFYNSPIYIYIILHYNILYVYDLLIYLSICWSIDLSIHLSIYLSIHLSISVYIYICVHDTNNDIV